MKLFVGVPGVIPAAFFIGPTRPNPVNPAVSNLRLINSLKSPIPKL
jgi:hypothetical protein